MQNAIREQVQLVVGVDLGDRWSQICCLARETGALVEETRLSTTSASFQSYFESRVACLVVVESGTHTPWVQRLLSSRGHQVIVANASKVRAISSSLRKTDERDARCLAQLGRVDPELLSPVYSRSEAAVEPLLSVIADLSERIGAFDQAIEAWAKRFPVTERLRQIKGVGALTALTFVLTLDDPHRFARSRSVGAYLGLVPASRSSGNSTPQLPITKHGDQLLRRLLVQAAHYILGPFGQDSDLRSFGLELALRGGGKNGKKRAVVAVARKLAVLMHRLWVSGEDYKPRRQPLTVVE